MYSPLFVTLMGIGTVFFGLICIIVLTTVMGSVLKSKSKPAAPAPAAARAPRAADKHPENPEISLSSVIGQIGRETSRQLLRGLFGNLRK